jgi:DNA repair exonuclease SbcCD ATPase subunit
LIIKEVVATGFGTLQQQRFSFQKGLNIIYGPNEAGKSTLQFFIYALLYGLKNKNSSTLIKDAARYRPWQQPEPFGGSMLFEVGGREYIVERSFTDKGTVKLADALTGGDLKDNFELDRRGELLFAQELLGLSPVAFQNITYIGQLASRCQKELAGELAGRLANLSTSGEEEISVETAFEALKRAKEIIGSGSYSTKPLSRLIQKEQELEEKQKELAENLAKLWQEQAQLVELQQDLAASEQEQKTLLSQQRRIQSGLLAQRLAEIGQRTEELTKIKRELLSLPETTLPSGATEQARTLKDQSRWLETELEKRHTELKNLQTEYKQLAQSVAEEEERRSKIVSSLPASPPDFYRALKSRQDALSLRGEQLEREQILLDSPKAGLPWPSLVLALIFGILALKWPLFFLPAGIMLVVFCVLLGQRQAAKLKNQTQLVELARREEELEQERGELAENFVHLEALLGAEPKTGILAWENQGEKLAQMRGTLAGLESQISHRDGELGEIQNQHRRAEEQIASLWQQAEAASWEEFWHQVDIHNRRQALELKGEQLSDQVKLLLAGDQLAELQLRFEEAGELPQEPVSEQDFQRASKSLAAVEEELQEKKLQLGKIQGRLDSPLESPAVVAARLGQVVAAKEELTLRRDALVYAEDVIKACAQDLHREFAPQLNHKVSQIFSALTCGRYDQVRVSEDLRLSLITPQGSLVVADNLSGGTLDQLYFALRLALSQLVGKEGVALPFLLDDTFVQYDHRRSKEGWQCLANLAQQNQILYFTCHREPLAFARADANIIDLEIRGEAG